MCNIVVKRECSWALLKARTVIKTVELIMTMIWND